MQTAHGIATTADMTAIATSPLNSIMSIITMATYATTDDTPDITTKNN